MSETKKVTSTAEIQLIKKPIPGPGKYKEHQSWKKYAKRTLGTYTVKDDKYTFIDEVRTDSKNIPASNKYKIPDCEVTLDRARRCSFNVKSASSIGERMRKVEKSEKESARDTAVSFAKTQLVKIKFHTAR